MKVKIKVSTSRVGSDDYSIIEIDEEDIVGLSDEEFEEYMGELAIDEIMSSGLIDWNWEVLGE